MQIDSAGALVSGGASGLGEATVRRLHGAGAHVVIADLNREKGEALAAELGDRAGFHEVNVTDPDAVEAAVTAASEAPRGLRIAVGCAGHRLGAARDRQAAARTRSTCSGTSSRSTSSACST